MTRRAAEQPEIRSWDKSSPDGEPARLVLWPEGAPDRSEVPQAGDRVDADGESGCWRVENGIPLWNDLREKWMLQLRSYRAVVSYSLSVITRLPDRRSGVERRIERMTASEHLHIQLRKKRYIKD